MDNPESSQHKLLTPEVMEMLQAKLRQLERHKDSVLGYPVSSFFDYSCLTPLFRYNMNNCGDWREYSNNPLNSFEFEKEVMKYFAELYKIPFE